MGAKKDTFGPFTQADGERVITLSGDQANFAYHSIALNHITTATGVEAIPTAGNFVLEAQRNGSNIWETLDVNDGQIPAATVGGWDIIRVAIQRLRVRPSGYDNDKSYFVIITGVE